MTPPAANLLDRLLRMPVRIRPGAVGAWRIQRVTVAEADATAGRLRAMTHDDGRCVPAGRYLELVHTPGAGRREAVVMSDTPDERHDHYPPLFHAAQVPGGARCLVNGLGLGLIAAAFLDLAHAAHVTVIEREPDVIALVGSELQRRRRYQDRLTIIKADAYTWRPPRGARWDIVWNDIWPTIKVTNLEDMARLHRKYARRCDWQGSWARRECLRERARTRQWMDTARTLRATAQALGLQPVPACTPSGDTV